MISPPSLRHGISESTCFVENTKPQEQTADIGGANVANVNRLRPLRVGGMQPTQLVDEPPGDW
jgi:hypothetical protein